MQNMDNIIANETGQNGQKGDAALNNPFSSESHIQQAFANNHELQRMFDTPQSLMGSLQFDLFASPFRSSFNRFPSSSSNCGFCQKEFSATTGTQFACSHKICPSCLLVTDSQKCAVCSSPPFPSPFAGNMFLSPSITPEHNNFELPSLHSNSPILNAYRPVNELSNALQNVSLGLKEPFSLWESSQSKLNTSGRFESLSAGDEVPVFSPSPLMNKDFRNPITSPLCSQHDQQSYPICATCGPSSKALAYCINCNELLCTDCVVAHQRVRVTRVHSVVTLAELLQHVRGPIKDGSVGDASSTSSPQPSSICSIHDMNVICTCTTCSGAGLCLSCLSLHSGHQLALPQDIHSCLKSMIADSKQRGKRMDDAIESVHRMTERVDVSMQSVASELRSVIHMQVGALEERKRELLQNLDVIRQAKLASLKTQGDSLASTKSSLQQILSEAESIDGDDESQIRRVFEKIFHLYSTYISLDPQENDHIKFTAPDVSVIQSNRTLGHIISGPCSATSTLIGEGVRRAIRDRSCSVYVQLRDACGEICSLGSENDVSATLLSPRGKPIDIQTSVKENGVIAITYLPSIDGIHILNVAIRGVPISECPVSIDVRRGRNYADIAARGELFSFGKEGSGDGELCRPWGICIDLLGRVLVADRSNNRIQIFDKDGNFIFKFGSGGTRPGQFDRPAGITSNTLNHIIVADKDNHRIQLFDESGTFLLKFGERGRPVGFFNYPWGVATNSSNNIAVSDTRNHRVQIFSPSGQFLRKCGFDTAYFYKHLDSPRGLCYLPDGTLLITDFNNHRLAILTRSSEMKVYGSEGEIEGMFCRPQGVKIDPEGHILVCDSRNNRIQVFSAEDMHCVAVFGQSPPGFQMPAEIPSPYQSSTQLASFLAPSTPGLSSTSNCPSNAPRSLLDRPTDLAISPDGRVYVVDFGNNCIRVF